MRRCAEGLERGTATVVMSNTPVAKSDPSAAPITRHDPRRLRSCLGHFATGVTVVTTRRPDGERHGTTVNSFTSISLDPALVMISIARDARIGPLLGDGGFVVNVLRHDQHDLAWHFAGRHDETLEVPWTTVGDRPALAGCLAHLSCSPWATYDGGDHVIHIGEIDEFSDVGGEPLLFHLGRFRHAGDALA